MKYRLLLLTSFWFIGCLTPDSPPQSKPLPAPIPITPVKSYGQVAEIRNRQKEFNAAIIQSADKDTIFTKAKEFWVNAIGNDLYKQWQGTPWDFNGTTKIPKQGNIACGYFVTTLLQDMGFKLDRVKLSTCASMTMMKKLTPHQAILNLSNLSYGAFNKKILDEGKGIYIIGLDFHTGFLVNDGTETWFLHSNYINREGVIKEKISQSNALKASQTRFVTSLTGDNDFLLAWITACCEP